MPCAAPDKKLCPICGEQVGNATLGRCPGTDEASNMPCQHVWELKPRSKKQPLLPHPVPVKVSKAYLEKSLPALLREVCPLCLVCAPCSMQQANGLGNVDSSCLQCASETEGIATSCFSLTA